MNEAGEFGEVVGRLHALARHPVDPVVARAHYEMLAAVTPPVRLGDRLRQGFSDKFRVGAAVVALSVAGGSGLAFAGSLPSPIQNAAPSIFDPGRCSKITKETPRQDRRCGRPSTLLSHPCD